VLESDRTVFGHGDAVVLVTGVALDGAELDRHGGERLAAIVELDLEASRFHGQSRHVDFSFAGQPTGETAPPLGKHNPSLRDEVVKIAARTAASQSFDSGPGFADAAPGDRPRPSRRVCGLFTIEGVAGV